MFASSSSGGIAGAPSSRLNFTANGVQGFPVVVVFDKVEEGVLHLLDVFIKTDSGHLIGKLQLYEPSTSFGSGQIQPFHVRFGVLHLVHS